MEASIKAGGLWARWQSVGALRVVILRRSTCRFYCHHEVVVSQLLCVLGCWSGGCTEHQQQQWQQQWQQQCSCNGYPQHVCQCNPNGYWQLFHHHGWTFAGG